MRPRPPRGCVRDVGVNARQQQVQAVFAQRIGQTAQHGQEERVRHVLSEDQVVRDHHRDRAVVLQVQVVRADVDRIVQRACQVLRGRVSVC